MLYRNPDTGKLHVPVAFTDGPEKGIVVALVCGSMIMTNEWENNAAAILYSWYAGMERGNLLARVLFGDVNPSGKLPFTIPTDPSHLHPFDNKAQSVQYGFYHGYRKLDKEGHTVAYLFGYGVSYTCYQYSEAVVQKTRDAVEVSVTVKNMGDIAGGGGYSGICQYT